MSSVRSALPLFVLLSGRESRGATRIERSPAEIDWTHLIQHIGLEWVRRNEACIRNSSDLDEVFVNYQSTIAKLGRGMKQFRQNGRVLTNGASFQSSFDPVTQQMKPARVVLGTRSSIIGVEVALRAMCDGEVARALIPGYLAFDHMPHIIPPDTSLAFVIERFGSHAHAPPQNVACKHVKEDESMQVGVCNLLALILTLSIILPLIRRVFQVVTSLSDLDTDDEMLDNLGDAVQESVLFKQHKKSCWVKPQRKGS
eukprot:TRINITY_DN18773_c0_g1_i1.p1 TRINITY_DN18773_c0_g1~~TRINITY_DN18773_c0_g1_i1.p1  ORF type:complete len:266 (+),score=29.00 TRINITY_DN18773_c0_g1_i1:33-800(+)